MYRRVRVGWNCFDALSRRMITPEALAHLPLFESARDEALATIVSRSADLHVNAGDGSCSKAKPRPSTSWSRAGARSSRLIAGAEQIVDVVEPGGFFGEVPLLLGSGFLAGVRAVAPSRLMRLEAIDFHELVASCPERKPSDPRLDGAPGYRLARTRRSRRRSSASRSRPARRFERLQSARLSRAQ